MQKPTSRQVGAFAGVIACVLVVASAAAQERELQVYVPPVPVEQLSKDTLYDLQRCLVAEADFGRLTEYSAIAYVFVRRWESAHERNPSLTFDSVVRRYCAMFRSSNPSPRQQWVLNLPVGEMVANPGFPSNVDWHNYSGKWDETRKFVDDWAQGKMRNPLPLAEHFGGAMDHPPLGAVLLPRTVRSIINGQLVLLGNMFYRIDQALRRLGQRPPTPRPDSLSSPVPAALAVGRFHR